MNLSSFDMTVRPPLSAQVSGQRCFFLDLRGSHNRSGLTLVYGGHERCDPDYIVGRNGFPFVVLELVASGEGQVTLDGETSELRAGSAFSYGAKMRVEIRTDPQRPMSKCFLCFTGATVTKRLSSAGIPLGRVRHLPLFGEALQLIEEMIREGRHERYATGRICTALAEVLFIKIEELGRWSGAMGREGEEEFMASRAMIDARFLEMKTLEELARLSGTSSSRLCRLFRRYQGISPYQYLLRRKMSYAAELLLGSGCRVREAAERVGFGDPYHFSRCFKAVHRLSPKQFQRSGQRS